MIDFGSMADFGIAPSLENSITELAEKKRVRYFEKLQALP